MHGSCQICAEAYNPCEQACTQLLSALGRGSVHTAVRRTTAANWIYLGAWDRALFLLHTPAMPGSALRLVHRQGGGYDRDYQRGGGLDHDLASELAQRGAGKVRRGRDEQEGTMNMSFFHSATFPVRSPMAPPGRSIHTRFQLCALDQRPGRVSTVDRWSSCSDWDILWVLLTEVPRNSGLSASSQNRRGSWAVRSSWRGGRLR